MAAAHRAPSAPVVTRRAALKATAVGAGVTAMAGGWTPIGRLSPAQATVPAPANLPSGIYPYLEQFKNWAGDVVTEKLWTIDARGEDDIVALANWAYQNGFKLRAKGFSHNWSPLSIANGSTNVQVLMVNTKRGLTQISSSSGAVTCGAGVSLDNLLNYLDYRGQGLAHHPAPGDVTIGGMLAIGAHGTVVPRSGESLSSGHSFGSLANLVTNIRAVVWDQALGRYVAKTYSRADYEAGALMVNLGRAFITKVTLRVGPKQQMRCQSYLSIPVSELLAPAGSGGRTVERYLNQSGRMEVIWFPFTKNPWFKVWTVTNPYLPPLGSIPVLGPYNYSFADGLFGFLINSPQSIYDNPSSTKGYTQTQADGVGIGLATSASSDLWGAASSLLRYVRPSTMKVTANGYAILCKRSDVQWVLNTVYVKYQAMLADYAAQWKFPVNGPMEIRVTGVDNPADCGVPGAQDPWLSATRRRPDRPDWNCAVWFDLLTLPNTPNRSPFYTEFEQWLFAQFNTDRTGIRVEWSKGWGYSNDGAYSNPDMIANQIPASVGAGQPAGTQFADAVRVFDSLDPHRIYTSPLLDRVLT